VDCLVTGSCSLRLDPPGQNKTHMRPGDQADCRGNRNSQERSFISERAQKVGGGSDELPK